MPTLQNQEAVFLHAEHSSDADEEKSRVDAQASLMNRHQQMIRNALAKGKGLEIKVEEPAELVDIVQKPIPITKVPQALPKPSGLLNFLSNATHINPKKTVSDDLPWCDATMASTEMTVATTDSESEQVLHDIHVALRQQEDRVESIKKEIDSNEDLAQVKYMSRDKVGATAALRVARLKQAELAQESVFSKKLDNLSRELQYASFDKEEQRETLQHILDSASSARSNFSTEVKVSDGILLKEIQKMIRKL